MNIDCIRKTEMLTKKITQFRIENRIFSRICTRLQQCGNCLLPIILSIVHCTLRCNDLVACNIRACLDARRVANDVSGNSEIKLIASSVITRTHFSADAIATLILDVVCNRVGNKMEISTMVGSRSH